MICISAPSNQKLSGEVVLPSSKSMSNRLLIMKALSDGRVSINKLSDADDTQILKSILHRSDKEIDVGDAGTAMRFLTAYFANRSGEWILHGSNRMNFRHIGPLVDALNQLGADIEFLNEKGYPPIKIKGRPLEGGKINIRADLSSQYISALMMIGPKMKHGLVLDLQGNVLSYPYIEMTAGLMRQCGVRIDMTPKKIIIHPGEYGQRTLIVEPDWSAASYWYEMAAISENAEITLSGLSADSLQGDKVLVEIFEQLGVSSHMVNGNMVIRKSNLGFILPETFHYNFSNCPDLAQTLAVTCATLNVPSKLEGLANLPIKETDRINALVTELSKMGASVVNIPNEGIGISPQRGKLRLSSKPIATYGDHRMALAFSPVALKTKSICLDQSNVVKKSYPGYWDDLKKFNFTIHKT